MGKEISTQIQETQRVPNRINPRWNTLRHILIKLTKIKHKEQILKATREKQQIIHKGIPVMITADLSTETLQARREWQNILKVMKEKNLQPRLLYPAKVSFKYESESEVAQSYPTLCSPMDCSLPGSSLHGILQARVLEWVAISFSRESSQPRDRTQISHIVDRRFTVWARG